MKKLNPLLMRVFEVASLAFAIGYVTLYKQEIIRSKGEIGYLFAIFIVVAIVIANVIDKRTWLSQLLRGRLGKKIQEDTISPSKEKLLKKSNSSGRHIGSVGFHIGFLVFSIVLAWYAFVLTRSDPNSILYENESFIIVAVIFGGTVLGAIVGLVLAILAAMKNSS